MKKVLAGLLAGLVLGGTGGALGAASYWRQGGTTYACEGGRSSVFCKETNWRPAYQVSIIPRFVSVQYGGRIIFGCERRYSPAGNCEYYGP